MNIIFITANITAVPLNVNLNCLRVDNNNIKPMILYLKTFILLSEAQLWYIERVGGTFLFRKEFYIFEKFITV